MIILINFFWVAPKQIKKFPNINRFDPLDGNFCKIKGSSQSDGSIDECCGDYPAVRPFNSSNKGCCSGTIFNKMGQECCNGVITNFGEPC